MNYKEIIISNYPLISLTDCTYECYLVKRGVYIIFVDNELICKKNMNKIIHKIDKAMNNGHFSVSRTYIIVGKTLDKFENKDLIYLSMANKISIFYLINDNNIIYTNYDHIYMGGSCPNQVIHRLNSILKKANYVTSFK